MNQEQIKKRSNFLILFLMSIISVFADKRQDSDVVSYKIEATSTFSGGENTPFWFVSNISGLGSPSINNGYLKISADKEFDSKKKFDWGAGIDLSGGWHIPAPFAIRKLYAELHYNALWISVGSRNFYNDYNDRRLSSGDLLFSGNAMALPQLRIGTNGFASFWGTRNWLAVRTYLAYGMFTDSKWMRNWVNPNNDYTKNVLLCSRGLWFRIGNQRKFPLSLDIGIEMATQFGGSVFKDGKLIKMPNKFADWIKAFIPYSGGETTPEGEQTNVQGNMNGEYNVALNWTPGSQWKIMAYYEHYFEDQSQMTFEYGLWKDGLWGLKIEFPQNKFISKLVYEYIGTSDQTGAVNHDASESIPEQVSGRDGYYTHYLYGAWQNWGMTIGTPLAISPLYNRTHVLTLYNTRFIANHFGFEGKPADFLNWRMLLTFSRNWGTYLRPLSERMDNFSGLLEIGINIKKFPGWNLKGAVAWDKGKLLGNNFGGLISLSYEGFFTLSKH